MNLRIPLPRWRLPGALFGLGLVLWLGGLASALDRRFPPALARAQDVSVVVTDEGGALLRAFLSDDDKWRLPVRLEDVDPAYIDLLVAYEDKRFYHHPGVDPLALARALGQWVVRGHVVSGASTITMQVVRLLEPRPRTMISKLIEMARALQLEWHCTKDEILALYLTLAPYGGNLEGVRAASLSYFGKEPDRLTLAEAALLVALPQSPERRRPDRHPGIARAARDGVLARFGRQGTVTGRAVAEAAAEAVPARRRPLPFHAPRLARRLKASYPEAEIRTALNGDLQKAVENFVVSEMRWNGDGAAVAVVVIDNATWRLKAYAGGGDFWEPYGQIDLAQAPRSPGSTLKPFLYGLAFDDLTVHPQTLIEDRPMLFGDYAPQNFDRSFQGTVTLRTALRQSLNVPAVQLLDRLGPVRLATALDHAGARLTYARPGVAPSLPLVLGGVGLRLVDLARLYAGLANGGVVRSLRIRAEDPLGPPRRLMSPAAAWYVTDILKESRVPEGWAPRRGLRQSRVIAFKTGTSYGFRDAWSVGYSGSYTVGLWVGRADGSARPGHYGRNTAAPLLLRVFDLLPPEHRALPPRPADALEVRDRRDLPVAMRRFQPRLVSSSERVRGDPSSPPPVIAFPANGVAVALPGKEHAGPQDRTLALKAKGGTLPLRWIVNGEVLPPTDFLETMFWQPDGPGFADIVVVDADGRTARSHIRLIAPR